MLCNMCIRYVTEGAHSLLEVVQLKKKKDFKANKGSGYLHLES